MAETGIDCLDEVPVDILPVITVNPVSQQRNPDSVMQCDDCVADLIHECLKQKTLYAIR